MLISLTLYFRSKFFGIDLQIQTHSQPTAITEESRHGGQYCIRGLEL